MHSRIPEQVIYNYNLFYNISRTPTLTSNNRITWIYNNLCIQINVYKKMQIINKILLDNIVIINTKYVYNKIYLYNKLKINPLIVICFRKRNP